MEAISSKKKAGKKSVKYDESAILHLEGLEHIRKRPGMYIGSLGDGSTSDCGIYVLLKEALDNSIDEYNAGFGERIDIEIKENRVKVRDYGRGIPLGKLDDCVANVNTGAKYNEEVFKQSIGMNGVGIKATNALSSYFRAASIREGKMATVIYEGGKKVSSTITEAKRGVKNGTYIEFVPDIAIFGEYQFNLEIVEHKVRLASFLAPGLKIYLNKTLYFSEKGLTDLIEYALKGRELLYPPISYKKIGEKKLASSSTQLQELPFLEFSLSHTKTLDKCLYSFVNGQETVDGGTHTFAFIEGIVRAFNDFYKKSFEAQDITSGLFCALKINISNPMFTSQTKNKLGNVEIRTPIIKEVKAALDDYLRHNPATAEAILEKINQNKKVREATKETLDKEIREAAKSIILKIPKLKDCRYHLQDGLLGEKSMIFITEGDSATGSMVACRDVSYQAIFSLRGKPENMFGHKKGALFLNEELKNLTFSLGVQKDTEALRYSKVIIATDADNDGYHIRNLVLTYLLLYFPELVLEGKVFILETPLFRVRNKKETVYCYSEEARDKETKRLGATAEVTRFKGLGEINGAEFGQFIHERKKGESSDKGIHLTQVSVESIKSIEPTLEFFMGKNTAERREFIVHHLAADIDA